MNYPAASDQRYQSLLFVDQSLEDLVTRYQSGYEPFERAYQRMVQGDVEAALHSLKSVLADPNEEIRRHLWAWKALRSLGEVPPSEIGDEVQGVVFEIPLAEWTDTLAAYADGRVRYLNGQVGNSAPVVWEATEDPLIAPLVAAAIDAAAAVVGQVPALETHIASAPERQPRISVLTFGGIYSIDRDETTQHITDPVLSRGTQLFVVLMEKLRFKPQG